jgi:hypothetical protein
MEPVVLENKERHVAICEEATTQLRLTVELSSSGWSVLVEDGSIHCEIALSLVEAKQRAEEIAIFHFTSQGLKTPVIMWDQVD